MLHITNNTVRNILVTLPQTGFLAVLII